MKCARVAAPNFIRILWSRETLENCWSYNFHRDKIWFVASDRKSIYSKQSTNLTLLNTHTHIQYSLRISPNFKGHNFCHFDITNLVKWCMCARQREVCRSLVAQLEIAFAKHRTLFKIHQILLFFVSNNKRINAINHIKWLFKV